MQVVALIQTYNEERFIGPCLSHLIQEGITVYLIDNESSDRTVEIARTFEGRGLVGIETLPRDGVFQLQRQLARKEELAATLDADWFIHQDADEFRVSPRAGITLHEAIDEAERLGANAVNFMEYTFIPTRENPDHDHPRFRETMRWYYPFLPESPHRVNAWRRQANRVRLTSTGGHRVEFPGLRLHQIAFPMKHYMFLSAGHAMRKYVSVQFDRSELLRGWHAQREMFSPSDIILPTESLLREYSADDELDASNPWTTHWLFAQRGPRRLRKYWWKFRHRVRRQSS